VDELPSFLRRMVSKRRTWYLWIGKRIPSLPHRARSSAFMRQSSTLEYAQSRLVVVGSDNPDLLLFFLVNATPGKDDESLKWHSFVGGFHFIVHRLTRTLFCL